MTDPETLSPAAQPSPAGGSTPGLFVAGIGASAGGLEALERLFKAMPHDTGVAFVVVQHLSPDFKSLMDELLARHTDLPIRRVENGMAVEPNTIFLIPPKKEMIISGGCLFLADKEKGHDLSLPIDHFFRSLAQDAGERAIGIILSGTGSDGSRGICDIHEAGGLVLAQNEETAKFDGMPRSAQNTGIVDCMLPPEKMPEAIVKFRTRPLAEIDCSPEAKERAEARHGLDAVFGLLRDEQGIDFSYYKPSTVGRRIERRQSIMRVPNLDEYVELLRSDSQELNRLYHDLLIGVTRFFRDQESFQRLEKEVLPALLSQVDGNDIRVWVAGCATGEEAYSLAILLHERLELLRRPVNVKIFASDVHQASLDTAAAGVYSEEAMSEVTPGRLQRFFIKQDDGYHVLPELRKMIVFARHNIIKDAPFTRLDMVTCRNLLIYLQPLVQKKVLSLFHFGLKTGGVLFLGPSESPGELSGEFQAIDEHWKLYRKRRDIRLPPDVRMPLTPGSPLMRSPPSSPAGFDSSMSFAYDELLDEYMPAGLLVTERRQLAHLFGDAGRFLKLRSGRPTTDVLELIDGDLKLALAGALQRAARDDAPVVYTGVSAQTLTGQEQLKVTVRPLKGRQTHVKYLYVALETIEVRPVAEHTGSVVDVGQASQEHVSALEAELRHTRESLQAAVEELESSNEELQASNEELLASNEELQSTNEELHSVNEELYTVNAEYQKKITELTELTDDMDNLLQSTDVGTIFLDEQLCIRKFTPQIGRSFRLLPQDIGRRIDGFSHDIRYAGLLADLETVLRTGERIEKEVEDRRGNWLFLRILPYHSHSRLAGVVLSLIDISLLKQAEVRLLQLGAIIDSSNDAIVGMGLDGSIETWNPGAERLFGYSAEEAIGQNKSLLRVDSRQPPWSTDLFAQMQHGDVKLEAIETQQRRKDQTVIDVQLSFSPIRDSQGALTGVSMIARDIGDRKAAERSLSERMLVSELRADIGLALARADDLNSLLERCTQSFVEHLNVSAARLWTVNREERLLRLQASSGTPHGSDHLQTPLGQTIIGRMGVERMRVIIDDLSQDARGSELESFGGPARGSFAGFPLVVADRVVGVLALWHPQPLARSVVNELASISFEIAQCIERKRSEMALRDAERDAQQGVLRRDQFLAMLSHELRNPLAAVLNAASLLSCDDIEDQARRDACGAIERQSQQMARLLDDLLDVSRITTGCIQLRRETVNLQDSARNAIEAIAPRLEASGAQFRLSLPDEPLHVDGDPARLQQIQVNLLSNAVKYTPAGGRIQMSVSRADGQANISVRDDGIGIPSDMQERVFDLFVRLDGAPGVTDQGMGVGLALVRALVQLHDGTVTVHSSGPGEGSEFTVRLPLADAEAPQEERSQLETRLTGLRLLLVDDNPDIRRMSSHLLERSGCEVRAAADGREALEALAAGIPDAALIDIGLPDMSGYEVAQGILAATDGQAPYLIAITGFGQPEDRRKALASGFDAHLVKPISLGDLLDLLAPLRDRE